MAAGNEVKLVGNTTRDPELKFTPSGTAVVNFGIAHNRRWQKDGEWQEEKSFFDVVAFGELAENIAESVAKGHRVVLDGRLQQRSWETAEGQKRSKIEIVLDDLGVSLKWGTTSFTKNESHGSGGGRPASSGNRTPPPPPSGYDTDEEPFVVDAGVWSPEMGIGQYPERMLP